MQSAGTERANGIRKRPAGSGKWQENAKKILNSGNKPKDLLKTRHLAFFGAKNKPKTNPILSAKIANQSEKTGLRWQVSGVRCRGLNQDSEFRSQDSGKERAGRRGAQRQ
jgi:hypothetical protein